MQANPSSYDHKLCIGQDWCQNLIYSPFRLLWPVMWPGKIVTISKYHNSRWFHSIKFPFWPKWLTKTCHNEQFVTISVVTITEKDCTQKRERGGPSVLHLLPVLLPYRKAGNPTPQLQSAHNSLLIRWTDTPPTDLGSNFFMVECRVRKPRELI